MPSELTAIVLGGSGQVGRHVLTSALASSSYAAELPTSTPGLTKRAIHRINFDQLDSQKLSDLDANAILISLGTTRSDAGSAERFKRIDQDYVVEFARAAKVEGTTQRIVYCSTGGSSLSSPFLYMSSKAQTEKRLSELGYDETIVFKPTMFAGISRPRPRIVETILLTFTNFASRWSDSLEIDVRNLGLAMSRAGSMGVDELKRLGLGQEQDLGGSKSYVLTNGEANKLARLGNL